LNFVNGFVAHLDQGGRLLALEILNTGELLVNVLTSKMQAPGEKLLVGA